MKLATLLLKYDYGVKERGESNEIRTFYPALRQLVDVVDFWLEDNGFPKDIPGLQDKIKAFITKEQPTHVFMCLMREEITRETMDWMRAQGVKVINWFCDDQWRLGWSLEIAKHLSVAVTVDKFAISEYKKRGIKAVHSQWGAECFPISTSLPEYYFDVSFVGSRNLTRKWYIEMLAKYGIKVTCFGSGWPGDRIANEQSKAVVHKSKINLNLSNSVQADFRFLESCKGVVEGHKFGEQIKARLFEIPAWGGFQLAHYAPETEDYFQIGKEIAVFTSPEECAKQIRYYLEHNEEREAMRHRAWRTAENYTYDKIMRRMLIDVEQV